MLSWEEKLTVVQPEIVQDFVAKTICGCKCKCMDKVRKLGEPGLDVIANLREARLSGSYIFYFMHATLTTLNRI